MGNMAAATSKRRGVIYSVEDPGKKSDLHDLKMRAYV